MGRRGAAMRPLVIGAAALALGVGGGIIGLIGCDRSGNQTVVAPRTPSTAPPPSTQEALAENEPATKDLDPIPQLGSPAAVERPGHEIWYKYPSGLMIFDIRPGSGMRPQVGMTVHVHYKGTFPDGKVFDESMDKPFDFVLGTRHIIKGWNLALSTMTVGGKRKIYVPADLAYGARGNLPTIYPNQDLIFEIELLSVTGKAANLPESQPATTASAEELAAPKMGPSTAPAAK
ncbi:MAG TPA: FKBP-type peptidyl-prolyl cis-trans isomerase [Phycisphaerae bacterium]|nr:FKBP-type peptidyl-prolyl cis-trans isomerase [Phycisphaerae bacterium]